MSTARFTPGPWQRSGVRVKLGAEDCLQVGPDGFPIAFLPIGKSQNEHAGAIADADLIAAAPKLLEAARMLAKIRYDGGTDGFTYDLGALDDAIRVAEDAIFKATGAAS